MVQQSNKIVILLYEITSPLQRARRYTLQTTPKNEMSLSIDTLSPLATNTAKGGTQRFTRQIGSQLMKFTSAM